MADEPRGQRPLLLLGWTAAAICLGQAVQPANGMYHPVGLRWLTAAIACAFLPLAVPARARLEAGARAALAPVIGVGLAWQLVQMATTAPGQSVAWDPPPMRVPFQAGFAAVGAAAALALLFPRGGGRVLLATSLAVFAGLGTIVLQRSPLPYIDVFMYQREGSRALLLGENPYASRYPDIYVRRTQHDSHYDAAEMSKDGYRTNGFPYPPASLLLALPGYALTHEYRFSQLAAFVGTAALMATAFPLRGRTGTLSALMAALFLFTPRSLYVVEMGWTEPLALLLVAALVHLAIRGGRGQSLALGLLLVIKQHLFVLAPLVPLLAPEPRTWRRLVRAGVVATAVTLPFLLWDPAAFWRSVVTYHLQGPFRIDSLNYASLLVRSGLPRPPTWFGFALIVPVMVVLHRALPRHPSSFAAGAALVLLAFFAFGLQAHCHYYVFILGLFSLAVATGLPREVC